MDPREKEVLWAKVKEKSDLYFSTDLASTENKNP